MLFLQNAGAKVQKNHRTAKLFPLFFSLPLFYYKKGIQKFGRLRTLLYLCKQNLQSPKTIIPLETKINKRYKVRMMKRLLFCFLVATGITMAAAAQQRDCLVVWHKDGSKVVFSLKEQPKVAYGDSLVTIQAATTVEYAFQAIQKMTFENEQVVGIKELETSSTLPFESDGQTVTFLPSDRDLRVRVVSLNGIVVKELTVRKDERQQFSFRGLPAGVYLMNVNGITYKIKTR